MWLGSSVATAVAQARSYSSNSTTSLGTSICCGCDPKKTKKKSDIIGAVRVKKTLTGKTPGK